MRVRMFVASHNCALCNNRNAWVRTYCHWMLTARISEALDELALAAARCVHIEKMTIVLASQGETMRALLSKKNPG